MCIRDSYNTARIALDSVVQLKPTDCALLVVAKPRAGFSEQEKFKIDQYVICLLYTSDAADERSSVDLGGRRIIKKKTTDSSDDLTHVDRAHYERNTTYKTYSQGSRPITIAHVKKEI